MLHLTLASPHSRLSLGKTTLSAMPWSSVLPTLLTRRRVDIPCAFIHLRSRVRVHGDKAHDSPLGVMTTSHTGSAGKRRRHVSNARRRQENAAKAVMTSMTPIQCYQNAQARS